MQENSREVLDVGTQTPEELHDKQALVEELDGRPDNKSESSRRHSSKPVGRERRLQPPVFKERIERFLSKLKIREVTDELDTIDDDTKEPQRYTETEKIARVTALNDSNLIEAFDTELKAPVHTNFSTEIIETSAGQQELRLHHEDGESRSLNALLPKGFRFEEGDTFEMSRNERTIYYMPEVINSKGGVLAILHEIGHARNYDSGKIEKSPFYTLSLNEKLRAGILHTNQFINKIGLPFKTRTPQWLRDKHQSWLARDERAAWTYALQEGRALEKQGFHIFAGFKDTEDVRDYINTALMTYEGDKITRDLFFSNEKVDIFSSKFVKQHVLDKKLEEATKTSLTAFSTRGDSP